MEFSMRRKYNVGDLCIADGYNNKVWEVEGYTLEIVFLYGQYEEEIIYNLKCITTNERVVEYQSDMTLVCRAAYAIEYIRQLDQQGRPPKQPVNNTGKEKKGMKKDEKVELTPYEYPDTKDGLLEELADLLSVVELVGEDEKLQRDINIIKFKLKKFVK